MNIVDVIKRKEREFLCRALFQRSEYGVYTNYNSFSKDNYSEVIIDVKNTGKVIRSFARACDTYFYMDGVNILTLNYKIMAGADNASIILLVSTDNGTYFEPIEIIENITLYYLLSLDEIY